MNRKLGLGLAAFLSVAGCVSPDAAGPYELDELDDGEGIPGGKVDDPTGTVCANKTQPPLALGGTVLTPTGPKYGYVVIQDQKIVGYARYTYQMPANTKRIWTGGIVSPGFIDLHNHVAYNFIPVWNSGRRWNDRYQWARATAYDTNVKVPYNAVKNAKHQCEGMKYGEFRAMTGGTTTIQGSVDLACGRAWVRNVEFVNFCEDHVRQNVLPINGISTTEAATLNGQFASGHTKAFLVHLAEGINAASANEFEQLRGLGLLKPQVVGIHSTGLSEAQINEMGQIGMKIVWSPLSNMMLYGKTTNIPAALRAGVKVALAPDWSPSGSQNSLGELKVADRVNKEQFGGMLTDKQLWEMVTANAADIVGMTGQIGRIQAGEYADLVIIRGDRANPYRAIIDADPSDVLLTVIGGEAMYGDPAFMNQMGRQGQYGTVDACGEARGLVTTSDDTKVPLRDQTLSTLTSTFTADGVKNIIPLFQCDAAPEWAFAPL